MTLREVLCQALNTGARGEGGCSTPSITRGNEIRPTPGAMHATDNVIRGDKMGNLYRQRENIASHDQARQQEPRTRPTTSYEATKPGSTADSVKITLHTIKPAHKHPTQRHTRQQASRLPLKPDRAHRKLRGQGLSDLPPQSEPAERRRKANTKPARS